MLSCGLFQERDKNIRSLEATTLSKKDNDAAAAARLHHRALLFERVQRDIDSVKVSVSCKLINHESSSSEMKSNACMH